MEFVEVAELIKVEQGWIDKTKCTDRSRGFNICTVAGSTIDVNAQVWEGFIDPGGNEVIITNLYAFCRHQELDFPSMHRLSKGKSKLKSYKGWTHRNSIRQREYVKTYEGFITPDGRRAGSITNLAEFCRKHGLEKTHMVAVAHGRIFSHHGWTYDNDRQNLGLPQTYSGFVNPDGQRVSITNLKTFCQKNALHPVHMYEVKRGKRKSHKGWTWRENNEQSSGQA